MRKRLNYNNTGLTLIELIVAMAMTTIVIVIIFATWSNFNRRIINQRRKGMLNGEIRQISEVLKSHIRRSPAILAWHSSGITYVSPNGGDTVAYEFYNEELLLNDVPLPLVSQKAYISNFSIGEAEQTVIVENKDLTLLSVKITIEDEFANQVTVDFDVAAKVAEELEEDLGEWNF
jgi:type II secretory pathway pseudopilin PulG